MNTLIGVSKLLFEWDEVEANSHAVQTFIKILEVCSFLVVFVHNVLHTS